MEFRNFIEKTELNWIELKEEEEVGKEEEQNKIIC